MALKGFWRYAQTSMSRRARRRPGDEAYLLFEVTQVSPIRCTLTVGGRDHKPVRGVAWHKPPDRWSWPLIRKQIVTFELEGSPVLLVVRVALISSSLATRRRPESFLSPACWNGAMLERRTDRPRRPNGLPGHHRPPAPPVRDFLVGVMRVVLGARSHSIGC